MKPCPFCLGTNLEVRRVHSVAGRAHYVDCCGCAAQGPYAWEKGDGETARAEAAREAIELWEKRA